MVRWAYYRCLRPLESFRFADEKEYECEIKVKVFARVLRKMTRRKTSFYFFVTKEVSTVIDNEGGSAFSQF